jgi:hypothetical protein
VATVVALAVALETPASAQHFGRNKVRYRTFDFQVLRTETFDIYYYPTEREGVDIAARLAERWRTRLERLFEHTLTGRQPLILYGSHTDFEQTNVIDGELGDGTAGVTEPIRRRMILPLAGPIADTDHVLGHELVHAFQFDITKRAAGQGGDIALGRLPLWFVEGMAEYASLGPTSAGTALRMRDAVRSGRLPSIAELNHPAYFPYHWGHAFFAYVAERFGDDVIPRLLNLAAVTGDVEVAINGVLEMSVQELSSAWHAALRELYGPAIAAEAPMTDARLITSSRALGSDLNVGPALSHDGHSIAYLSSQSVFSIELYIADVETGRVRRKVTSTSTSPHYSSIQFIHSTGTWDPSGERIAVATIVSGRPALAIFNARTGNRDRDVVLKEVDEILNPSWSPEGHAIAMTGLRHGVADLFVYDLQSASLQQLTDDAYADLHPSWSPDGRRIAFATDRFSSDLASLDMGEYRLAIADASTGVIVPVPAFGRGKHINPQWSPDGSALYFVAEPDGIPNVYRVSLVDGTLGQLTFLATGVTGITYSSPALSVASGSGLLATSVLENDRYDIYVQHPKTAAPPRHVPCNAAALASGRAQNPVVAPQLDDPALGLPARQDYPSEPYKARLSLDGFGQPTAGVGTSRFGTTVGGGGAVYFSDMLGDHLLATAAQVNQMAGHFSANDIAVETGYFNLKRRWSWGLVGGQIPYTSGTYDSVLTTSAGGEPVFIERQVLYRQTQRSASGVVSYPINRARRVEFHGGLAQTSFETIVWPIVYSLETGLILSEETERRESYPSLTLATTAAAIVFDTANFGPTGPVQGQRYRLEVTPTLGAINFTGVLVDYRKYMMPVSFYTIAVRVLHYGRYGDGADDPRLYPVYVNSPSLVRGYDTIAYSGDCGLIALENCYASSPYVGSRMLAGNVELRLPLLRPFGMSSGMYGPAPVELAIFGDSGVAWSRGVKPRILGGSRSGITSTGVALRVGLGFAVAEFNVTRPFQRIDDNWVFGFNLMPGW